MAFDLVQQVLFDQLIERRKQSFHEPSAGPGKACFLLAAPRTGSTLLRSMLAGSPSVLSPPEHGLLHLHTLDQMETLESLPQSGLRLHGLRYFCQRHGIELTSDVQGCYRNLLGACEGRVWLEKSTSYALFPDVLARIERLFENPRYIVLSRSPRACIASFLECEFERLFFSGHHPFPADDLAELVWERTYRNLESLAPERTYRLNYEALVAEPEAVLAKLCAFLRIEYGSDMASPWSDLESRNIVPGCEDPNFTQHAFLEVTPRAVWPGPLNPATLEFWEESDGEPVVRDSLFGLFRAAAQKFPERPCLGPYTYAQFLELVQGAAVWLRSRGVMAGSRVALGVPKSESSLALLLACLGLEACYLPLDPEAPPRRRAELLERAEVNLIVDRLPELEPSSCPLPDPAAEAPGYLLFTSGSGGEPKGVVVSQGAAASVVQAQISLFEVDEQSRVLQAAPWTFDTSVVQIFMALGAGAELVLPPGPPGRSEWAQVLAGLTHLDATPSHLQALGEFEAPRLKVISSGGEACSLELVKRLAPGRRFFHCYGTTETAICNTVSECFAEQTWEPTLGRVLPGSRAYLLDESRRPVAWGEVGQLYLGGEALAEGYLDGSQDRFQDDPFHSIPGARMFATGDLARWDSRGELVFEGRVDRQLNLQGRRVDPAEIERVLLGVEGVLEAYVTERDGRLVAYLGGTPADVESHLAAHLPPAMRPAHLIRLKSLPRSPSGKLEPSRLPPPGQQVAEHWVAEVWQEVLGSTSGRIFDLGGTSLDLLRLQSALESRLGRNLPISTLFEYPDPDSLRAHLENVATPREPRIRARRRSRTSAAPLLATGSVRFMSAPQHFSVEHTINPWMEGVAPADLILAEAQWLGLKQALEARGQQVQLVTPGVGLPDMTFTADCGLLVENRMLVSRFRHPERQGESAVYAGWFESQGFEVVESLPGAVFEGLGDIVVAPRGLLFGHGPRSSPEALESVRRAFPHLPLLGEVRIVDERFYHTASALAVLDEQTALYFPGAFDSSSCVLLQCLFPQLVECPAEDALNHFACNCLCIDREVLMAGCSAELESELAGRNFSVHRLELSEFRKSGAGPRCLVLDSYRLKM